MQVSRCLLKWWVQRPVWLNRDHSIVSGADDHEARSINNYLLQRISRRPAAWIQIKSVELNYKFSDALYHRRAGSNVYGSVGYCQTQRFLLRDGLRKLFGNLGQDRRACPTDVHEGLNRIPTEDHRGADARMNDCYLRRLQTLLDKLSEEVRTQCPADAIGLGTCRNGC